MAPLPTDRKDDIGDDIRKELAALHAVATDRTPAGRRRLAGAIGDFFVMAGGSLGPHERSLAIDILRRVLHDAEMEVRQALAERLADEPTVPRELIVMLANDTIEIAGPVLLRSLLLTDDDLIAIVRRRADDHRIAVARRPRVSAPVGDALVETGSVDVAEALLGNPGAVLSACALERLTVQARRSPPLRRPLLSRPEMTADLASQLYWQVSIELRRHILERFALPNRVLDKALERTIQRLIDAIVLDDVLPPEQTELVERLGDDGAIRPPLLIQVLRARQFTLFKALLGRLAGLPVEAVGWMITPNGGEALALTCRALGIDKGCFASIFLLSRAGRPGDHIVDPRELSRVLTRFDRMPPDNARTILEGWRRDPGALRALLMHRSGNA